MAKEKENKNKLNFGLPKNNDGNKSGGNKNNYSFYWIYVFIALAFIGFQLFMSGNVSKDIHSNQTFFQLMEKGFVKDVVLWKNTGKVDFKITESGVEAIKKGEFSGSDFETIKKGLENNNKTISPLNAQYSLSIASNEAFLQDFDKINTARKEKGFDSIEYKVDVDHNYMGQILSFIIPIILIIALWLFIMRRMTGGGRGPGGQIFNIGKSKAKVFEKGKGTDVTFKDVAGLEGAKEEVEEIVSFLKNPNKYTELGAKIPKGAILVGPPGTGKTLLAKAVAGEAGVPFFSLSGSDFVEMFVGVGASRVRDLFKQAKEKSPSIIFIDEIDAIGRARGNKNSFNSNDERENTLNQLLTEMDGFGTNSGVIILAATNRADVLDKALMRAGRFDRQIYVDMPDLPEREAIFKVHLKPIKLSKHIDVDFLAKQTPGFSGADIANLCNEAALIAARKDKKEVEMQDFLDAVDRIIGGLEKKNKIITKDEKRKIAFHESGHATVSWLAKHAHPLVKVTIVPRGQSLGAAWYLPQERMLTTTDQILDEICAALGGRAAEEIMFGEISTGALSDLEKVTKQAYAMVTIYGLNEKIGNISFYDSQGQNSFTKPYSEETSRLIDEEVGKIIETQYARAKDILSKNKDKLTLLADKLLEKEVIFKEDLEDIFGPRPWDKLTPAEKIAAEEKKNEGESSSNHFTETTSVKAISNETSASDSGNGSTTDKINEDLG